MVFAAQDQPLYEMKADLFKGLAHPYRIRILEILSNAEEVSVSTLISEIGIESSHLSQHLSVLRRYRLVTSERRASIVYYRLAFEQVAELLQVTRHLITDMLQLSHEQLASVDSLPKITLDR